jgi:hypothetical protein
MEFTFSERPWTPQDVLNYWQEIHGILGPTWELKFLDNPLVKDMCLHHPSHIRKALKRSKKVEIALRHIITMELDNEKMTEIQLDERHPSHAFGISNAHHGARRTDPFDPDDEELLFKCHNCNLKMNKTLMMPDPLYSGLCLECSEKIVL